MSATEQIKIEETVPAVVETVATVEETPVEQPEAVVEEATVSEVVEEPKSPSDICAQFPSMELAENAERVLIKQGTLSSKSRFKSSKRIVYLFSDYAVFAKTAGKGKKVVTALKQVIDLSTATVGETKVKNAFVITTPNRSFTMQGSQEEVKEWSELFAAQIVICTPEPVVEEKAEEPVVKEAEKLSEIVEEPVKVSEVVEEAVEEPGKVSEVVEEAVEEPVKVSEVVEEAVEEPTKVSEVAEEAVEEPAKVSEVVEEAVEEPVKVSEVVEEVVEEPVKVSEVAEEAVEEPVKVSEVAEEAVEEPVKVSEVAEEAVEEPVKVSEVVEEPKVELTEEQQVVADILAQFPAEIVPENAERTLVKQGDLSRKQRMTTSPRKVYLFSDYLLLVNKKAETKVKVLDLSEVTITSAKNAISVDLGKKNYLLKASSSEEASEWVALLSETAKNAALKVAATKAVELNGGGEALMDAVIEADLVKIALLMDHKADATYKNEEGLTAVHVAALSGAVEVIKLMAEKGCVMDEVDVEGRTAFQMAATRGHTRVQSVTNAFVGAGVESDAVLRMAAQANQLQSVMALVASGTSLTSADANGKVALHYAAAAEDAMEVIQVLVEARANVNVRDSERSTPLHYASSQAVAEYLVASGARFLENAAGVVAGSNFEGLEERLPSVSAGRKVCAKGDWVSDKASKACQLCEAKFTFMHRRHHCRSCGVLCCSSCSQNVYTNASAKKPLRSCDGCFNSMKAEVAAQVEEVLAEVEEVVAEVADAVEEAKESEVVEAAKESEVVVEEEPKESEVVEAEVVKEDVAAEVTEAVETVIAQATEIAA